MCEIWHLWTFWASAETEGKDKLFILHSIMYMYQCTKCFCTDKKLIHNIKYDECLPYNWKSSSILSLNHLCFGLKNLSSLRFSFIPGHQVWSFCFLCRENIMTILSTLRNPEIIMRSRVFNLSYHIFLSVFSSNQVADHFCQMCSLITQTAHVSGITLSIITGQFSQVIQA